MASKSSPSKPIPKLYDIEVNSYDGLDMKFDGRVKFVTTLNANVLLYTQKDEKFKKVVQDCIVTLDGQWLMWAMKRKYGNQYNWKKVSGSDFIYQLPKIAKEAGQKIMLLAASEDNNKKAVANLREHGDYDGIYGYSPPFSAYPFTDEFQQAVKNKLREVKPNILVLCLGVPKQEYWASENKAFLQELNIDYVMFLGATIDFVSGNVKRAPKFLQKIGMEAAWRIYQDPAKLKVVLSCFKIVPPMIFNRI